MDDHYCSLISSSIGSIMISSSSSSFRNECFKTLNVTNTYELQDKINEKLLQMSKSAVQFTKKSCEGNNYSSRKRKCIDKDEDKHNTNLKVYCDKTLLNEESDQQTKT